MKQPDGFLQDAPSLSAEISRDPALAALLTEYIESQGAENTRRAYRTALEEFLQSSKIATADAFLATEAADVAGYRNGLQRRKLSAATINQRLAAIRGLFRRLMKLGRIERNPADPELVPGLRASQESRTEGLALEDLGRMLETCDGTLRGLRDRAILLTLFFEGLRRSEASKLNYRDVSTRRGLLEVRDAKNNPYDTVRLRPEVRQAIEDYLDVLSRELRRRETKPGDPVFVSLSRIRSYGARLAADSINKIVKARAKAAGLDQRVHAHALRHCCATEALQAGAPLHQVQRHLRHKDIRTTVRYDRERDVRRNPTMELMPPVQ
jgi:integrase/recombinase XerD